MTVTTRALPLVLALFSVAVIDACKKAPPPPPAPMEDTAAARRAREDSIAMERQRADAAAAETRRRAAQDSIDRVRAAEEAARRDSEMLRSTVTAVINFDFDKSDLRDDAKANLDAKVPVLLANSNVTIRISGHADERGSSEYNLALGDRRANAVRDYLTSRGVPASRLETRSYGEERPKYDNAREETRRLNRRAALVVKVQ